LTQSLSAFINSSAPWRQNTVAEQFTAQCTASGDVA